MFAFQQATPDDAEDIARVVIASAGGVADKILNGLIPGLSSVAILSAAFIKGEGPYRTDNVIRSREGERLTSLLFAYPSSQHAIPALLESLIPSKRLAPFRLILERSVPDSLYINTLWLEETQRGRGRVAALFMEAESLCRLHGFRRMSLFCWNDDTKALRFLARYGFVIAEHFEAEALPVEGHGMGGSLLCKEIKG